jgi:LuxR family transcriptional regulator, maltose regulon positive regulatory protein
MIKSFMLLARIEKARRNTDAVHDALRQAEGYTDDRYAMNLLTQTDLPSIKEWHAEGFLQPAFRWADKWPHNFTPEPDRAIHQGITFASLARLFLAREDFAAAGEILGILLPVVEKKNLNFAVIEVLMLQALSMQAQGDIPVALDYLNRALSLARPAGYIRMFLDEGEAMQSLLHRVTGANRRYAATLIYAHDPRRAHRAATKDQPGTSTTSGGVLIEPLSRRELEVIPLLAEGLSNLELARRLHISMDTVKVHLRHIYQKLGVNSRSKAAIRARELSLM